MARTVRRKTTYVAPVEFQETVGFEKEVTFQEDICVKGEVRIPSGNLSLGDLRTSDPAVLDLKGSTAGSGKPAVICLHNSEGDDYHLWVDSEGKLRISEEYPTDDEDGEALLLESEKSTKGEDLMKESKDHSASTNSNS